VVVKAVLAGGEIAGETRDPSLERGLVLLQDGDEV
jgi:hypothetical protein